MKMSRLSDPINDSSLLESGENSIVGAVMVPDTAREPPTLEKNIRYANVQSLLEEEHE
jgi:hypothetical protein